MVKLVKQDFEKNKILYKEVEQKMRKRISKEIPITHVGSTAIPDMYGKNIIDILIGAKDEKQFMEISKLLTEMKYIPSEKSKTNIYQFFASKEEETGSGDIHIHLVMMNTQRYSDFITLKLYLTNNPDEATKYSDFKKEIINDGIIDRGKYKTIKSKYVAELLERARKNINK